MIYRSDRREKWRKQEYGISKVGTIGRISTNYPKNAVQEIKECFIVYLGGTEWTVEL